MLIAERLIFHSFHIYCSCYSGLLSRSSVIHVFSFFSCSSTSVTPVTQDQFYSINASQGHEISYIQTAIPVVWYQYGHHLCSKLSTEQWLSCSTLNLSFFFRVLANHSNEFELNCKLCSPFIYFKSLFKYFTFRFSLSTRIKFHLGRWIGFIGVMLWGKVALMDSTMIPSETDNIFFAGVTKLYSF